MPVSPHDGARGASADATLDATLRERAESQGKAVHSEWGDVKGALEYTASLPEPVQLRMFGKTLEDSDMYTRRVNAWLAADVDTLAAMADESAAAYPEAYRAVNAERNAHWAERSAPCSGMRKSNS